MLSIANLSRSEKLQMMEAIWEDLTRDVVPLPSPSWHIEALQQAERAYAENRARFVSWDVAKQMLRDKASCK
ncbi:MAG: addiction module protein [Gallionella sp.]|nr:addiction module protein [Gallionella sp.]